MSGTDAVIAFVVAFVVTAALTPLTARFARRVMEQSDPARIHELVQGFEAGTERG